jgi:hypothetical protein
MQEHNFTVSLADIVDIEALPDRPLDMQHVAALVATNEPDKWPPIIVAPINNKYGRIAGKHRIAAARKLGLEQLNAIARYYPDRAAMYVDMWEDNIRNGKPLTTKERKAFSVQLHTLQPGLSLRELGRRVGFPHPTTKRALEEQDAAPGKEIDDGTRIKQIVQRFYAACTRFSDDIDEYAESEIDTAVALMADYLDVDENDKTTLWWVGSVLVQYADEE